jgi:hypothetical protein
MVLGMSDIPSENIQDIPAAGTSGPVTVHLVYLGEGYSGDYDPEDAEDAPLYRIDVDINAEHPGAEPQWSPEEHIEAWGESGTSTCTTIVANDSTVDYRAIAAKAAALVDASMHAGPVEHWGPKRIMAVLSYWTTTDHPESI